MIILVEGNEGTGKTTLINSLMEVLPATSLKISKSFGYTVSLYKHVVSSRGIYLVDRSFITDIVYRIFDNGKCQMKLRELIDIFNNFDENVAIIRCINENGFDEAISRGEKVITKENDYEQINKLYDVVFKFIKIYTSIPIFNYDYHLNSIEDVIKFLKEVTNESI